MLSLGLSSYRGELSLWFLSLPVTGRRRRTPPRRRNQPSAVSDSADSCAHTKCAAKQEALALMSPQKSQLRAEMEEQLARYRDAQADAPTGSSDHADESSCQRPTVWPDALGRPEQRGQVLHGEIAEIHLFLAHC